ncbi:MAG: TetR/AcrR family transcriptional regulator [Acidimicrobiales bacterium]
MINTWPAGIEGSTRDRLLAAGIRLFAERGFRETTVGDIEAAAGLQPRRGALYHHFPTKQALLEAAVSTHVAMVEAGLRQMDALPGADLRTAALLMGRWFLAELDAERYLCRILEQDGERLPEIRDLIRERIIDAGHRRVEQLLRRRSGRSRPGVDTAALAALIVGPLANQRRVAWTYGGPPLGIDDERLLATWSNIVTTLIESVPGKAGDRPSTGARRRRNPPSS